MKKERALVVYYSATRNTETAARWLAKDLAEYGFAVDCKSVLRCEPANVAGYDLLVFATPVFSWRPAKPMRDFIAAMPRLENKPAGVLLCFTGKANNSYHEMHRSLTAKGAVYLTSEGVIGEESYPVFRSAKSIPGLGQPNEAERVKVARFAGHLIDSLNRFRNNPATAVLEKPKFSVNIFTLLAKTTPEMMAKSMGAKTIDASLCTRCLICVNHCPSGCLQAGDPPKFTEGCIGCCSCYNRCPTGAVKASHFGEAPYRRYRGPQTD